MNQVFRIHTKDDEVIIEAKNKDYAFAKYFKDIATEKVSLDKIGNLIMLHDEEGEEYPFRTVPLLWKMGIIDMETAIATLQSILTVSTKEAQEMIEKYGEKDGQRMIPLIEELILDENSESETDN